MNDLIYLRDIVVILGAAVIVVALFHRLKVPAIAGFILAGIIIGPNGLVLVDDAHQVEILAEVGVALLLFGIGMELSLERLRRFWRLALAGGFLQLVLSVVAAYSIGRIFGLPAPAAMFVGLIIALSSTAIVLRGLEQRDEIDAPHGRLTLGILVFQDLSVVPMMLAIPLLSGLETSSSGILGALMRSLVILVVVIAAARIIIPRVLDFVARTRQRHLFILAVFVISVGTAWMATISGVSLALGAFLAGLVVADSEYRHQALADLTAFREIFSSIFFVSVGMLLVPLAIFENISVILAILAAVIIGKFVIVFITGSIMQLPLRVSILAAAALAQVGEFSFVLARAARGSDLLPGLLESNLITAAILSMLVAPFGLAAGPHLAAGVGRLRIIGRLIKVSTAQEASREVSKLKGHVIIGGYGFAGEQLAGSLLSSGIPCVIAELNIENVRRASQRGVPVYFGDITSPEVLGLLGVDVARELVIVINDPSAAERAVRSARSLAPGLHIVVRTNYLLDREMLKRAGADEIIPAEAEAAIRVSEHILSRHSIETSRIEKRCSEIRDRHAE